MLVVSHFELDEAASRTQPWGKTEYAENAENAGQYYSFREKPELIREVLEDLKPHEDQRAVQRFYELLEWLNQPSAFFETNDCALRPPADNTHPQFQFSKRVSGRLEFFFRDLKANTDKAKSQWLYRMLSLHLQVERPDFYNAIFDISGAPTDYIDLPGSERERTGVRFSIGFNAYGNGDTDAWNNLDIAMQGLFEAFKGIDVGLDGAILKFP
ncbi:hypothetical protein LJR277_002572 [Pseudomonas sp. LjRoot277]|uniref:hypothetical protein n=1 Tax=Pseudomonas sp. LjRoot277 TaxID=3342307 RepID=UPI003ECCCB8D